MHVCMYVCQRTVRYQLLRQQPHHHHHDRGGRSVDSSDPIRSVQHISVSLGGKINFFFFRFELGIVAHQSHHSTHALTRQKVTNKLVCQVGQSKMVTSQHGKAKKSPQRHRHLFCPTPSPVQSTSSEEDNQSTNQPAAFKQTGSRRRRWRPRSGARSQRRAGRR